MTFFLRLWEWAVAGAPESAGDWIWVKTLGDLMYHAWLKDERQEART